jgi:tetratricopeptide (TPR) repeat protein
MRRAVLCTSCVLLLALALAPGPAHAGVPEDALALAEQGEREPAAARLEAWVRGAPAADASALPAVRAAALVGDLDLLERLQGWLEGQPAAKEPGPVALALATLWLARAEAQLASGQGGSSTAFLFADAAAKAQAALASPVGPEALVVLARVKYAQGDAEGALATLAAHPELAKQPAPSAMEGGLLYEHALARHLGEDGRPTEEGALLLARAAEALARALASPAALTRSEAGNARIQRAYALHRLGDLPGAAAAYEAAHLGEPDRPAALRGLESLFTGQVAGLRRALRNLLAERAGDRLASRALAQSYAAPGPDADVDQAIAVAKERIDAAPRSADGYLLLGDVLLTAERRAEAEVAYRRALDAEPGSREGVARLERLAAAWMATDVERGISIYEAILRLLPDDPFVRNNLGFVLREAVTPFTTTGPHEMQRIKPDAPHRVRAWLERSVAAYADAVRLVPESDDKDLDDARAWNLAGIVNDYALMLHYFSDVQDLPKAEALYWRALRMTRFSFKDTYAPNLQRLYGLLLPHREWAWYVAARQARDAILVETGEVDPTTFAPVLVPDTAKREAASRDLEALRARLVRTLKDDADSDGVPFPPPGPPEAEAGR